MALTTNSHLNLVRARFAFELTWLFCIIGGLRKAVIDGMSGLEGVRLGV